MKASFRWIQSLVPGLPDDPADLAARYVDAGLEVEGLTVYGRGNQSCEIARVRSMRPHPSKSGLRLVTLDRGPKGTLEVVCGAPNVPEAGGGVVFAPLGTHLPAKGMTIERRTIAGVISEGMLCSESELGLADEADGIVVLPKDMDGVAAGTPLLQAIPAAQDTLFEIGLTANRADGLGHIGLAREAAALYGLPWSLPTPLPVAKVLGVEASSFVKVTVEDTERCHHYAAAVLEGVTVGPSPLWMRYRLASLGVRPLSNLVDVTNLVMLEYGHPLHAFDLDRVRGGRIVVRRARAGERLKTLDGVERTLDPDDLLICDGEGPVALAGVMGGGDSEIGPTTRRVLLECASFDPRTVRRTARRHGLHTDASHRFERGIDHGDTARALARAAELVASVGGRDVTTARGAVVAQGTAPPPVHLRLRGSRMATLLGAPVPIGEAEVILRRLGFDVRPGGDESLACTVPTHRPDVTREVDLIDEVARVRGLHLIPTVLPPTRPTRDVGGDEAAARTVRAAAVTLGLSEAVTFGFCARAPLEAVGAPAPVVVLKNPLSELQSVMRTSVLPGLLEAVGRARRHGERDARLFTVGRIYLGGPSKTPVREPLAFAAVMAGERRPYLGKAEAVDVWDAKGLAVGMVEQLLGASPMIRAVAENERPQWLHPRAAGSLELPRGEGKGLVRLGAFGLLHPDVADAFDLDGTVVVVELDVPALVELAGQRRAITYKPLPRFPGSPRDIALVVRDGIPVGDVEAAVKGAAGALASQVELFDRFIGSPVPEHHASLAFRIHYRADDRTLTDAEVDAQHAKVVAEVGARFGATLRS